MINYSENNSLKVKFYLKGIGCEKSQIWLDCKINRERTRVYTGKLIKKDFWINKNRGEIGECASEDSSLGRLTVKENKEINAHLKRVMGFCKDYMQSVSETHLMSNNTLTYSKEAFKEYFYGRIKGVQSTPIDFIKNYIERKKQMVNKDTGVKIANGTIYNHTNALKRFETFCKDKNKKISWDIFNKDFERIFTSWLTSKKYAPNTISGQFSIIKVWLKEAEEKGLLTDKAFHHYQTKSKEVENIYLTEEEINKIYQIDFTKDEVKKLIDRRSHIEETRDLFIIACWTGLRFGDWRDLSNVNISNGNMIVHTQKTRQTVEIPLHPMVKDILRKYDGNLPRCVDRSKSLRHIRLCAKIAGINENTTITKVKGGECIVEAKPKYQFVMNHTARRTFATLMYLKGVPTISIMAITGHKTEENFMKYIKLDRHTHASIVAKAFSS